MLIKIECPECKTEGTISLADLSYDGPYKCWKCKGLFNIKVENDILKSCEPLSQEEFDQQQEIEALKAKFRRQ